MPMPMSVALSKLLPGHILPSFHASIPPEDHLVGHATVLVMLTPVSVVHKVLTTTTAPWLTSPLHQRRVADHGQVRANWGNPSHWRWPESRRRIYQRRWTTHWRLTKCLRWRAPVTRAAHSHLTGIGNSLSSHVLHFIWWVTRADFNGFIRVRFNLHLGKVEEDSRALTCLRWRSQQHIRHTDKWTHKSYPPVPSWQLRWRLVCGSCW